jgi:hypothetical protein
MSKRMWMSLSRVIALTFLFTSALSNEHGMCTEPPKEEGADCGSGDPSHEEHASPFEPQIIDVTATIHAFLPSWSVAPCILVPHV